VHCFSTLTYFKIDIVNFYINWTKVYFKDGYWTKFIGFDEKGKNIIILEVALIKLNLKI